MRSLPSLRGLVLVLVGAWGGCEGGVVGTGQPVASAVDAATAVLPDDLAASGPADLSAPDLSTPDLQPPPDLDTTDLTPPPDLTPIPPDFLSPSLAPGTLLLNEVHSANLAGDTDEDGDAEDWIEIVNATPDAVDLTGVGLSNKGSAPLLWQFPAGAAIPGRGYLVVWASKKNRAVWGRPLHASFTLENGGDTIYLTAPGNVTLDTTPATAGKPGVSWCRLPDLFGPFQHCPSPTRRAANKGPGYPAMLSAPGVSVPGGVYAQAQMVELTAGEPGVELRYTVDGSEPTANSLLYRGPIPIASRVGAPNVAAPIRTTSGGFGFYTANAQEVAKATVLRAAAFANGKLSSPINTQTYFVDPNLGPDLTKRYPGAAVVSLAADPPKYFSNANPSGIYVPGKAISGPWDFAANYWLPIEVQASMEMWNAAGKLAFRTDFGSQISGNYSRNFQQKSLDVIFRDAYGNKNIDYPLFPNRAYSRQKRFRLRNTGNDFGGAELHDAYFNRLAKGTAIGWGDLSPAVVFLNGEYWGYHEIREKTTSDYLAGVYGVDPDNVDIIDIEVYPNSDTVIVKDGTRTNFDALLGFVANHAMTVQSNYDVVKSLVDVDNLAQYWVAQMYGNNWDWPHNNLRMWRSRADDGKWRWVYFDVDFNLTGDPATSYFGTIGNGTRMGRMMGALIKNNEFKTLFINAIADLLSSAFKQSYMNDQLTAVANQLQPLMLEHFNRYNLQGRNLQNWQNSVQGIRTFINAREANFLTQARNYFALPNVARYSLSLDVNDLSMGTIQINTLDLSNWLVQGARPWVGQYFPGVPVTATALPKPGFKFTGWRGASNSASATVTLNLAANASLTATFAPDPNWVPGGKPPPPMVPAGLRDLALSGRATQSSTMGTGYAQAAIDGDFNGVYASGSVTHTNSDANAWWQVDLGQSSALYDIQLSSRTDCCADRLSELTVFVSEQDMTGRAYNALLGDANVWKAQVAGVVGNQRTLAAATRGRYVRVQLSGTNYLSLAEVVVRGTPAPPLVADASRLRNLALSAQATQSSTGGGAAKLAVDGNPDGVMMNRSVAQTAMEDAPWWEVDLGGSHPVSRLELWNRTDCCGNLLGNASVYLSEMPMAGRSLAQLDGDPKVWRRDVVDPVAFLLRIPVEARGRYLRVQLRGRATQLALGEVVVLGDPAQ